MRGLCLLVSRSRVDWQFVFASSSNPLSLQRLEFGASWNLANILKKIHAEQQSPAPVEQAELNPWAGSSFPLENFTAYTSPFGYRNHPFGGYRFHYGLDFAAPMGSYIRNWWDGTVIQVSEGTACGTSAIIQSGKWTHVYCHMQGHIVVEKEGGRVLVDREGGIALRQGTQIRAGEKNWSRRHDRQYHRTAFALGA